MKAKNIGLSKRLINRAVWSYSKIIVALATMVFLVSACQEEDTGPTVLTEITIEQDAIGNATGWAVASSLDGEILAEAELTKGSNTTLTTNLSVRSFNLTILFFLPDNRYHVVNTHAEVPNGTPVAFLLYDPPAWNKLPALGIANIDVLDPNVSVNDFFLTAKLSGVSVSYADISGGVRFACEVKSNPEDIFLSTYRGEDPVYKWLTVAPGQTYTLRLADFNPFSRIIQVPTATLSSFYAFGENAGKPPIFFTQRYLPTGGIVRAGVLDGFESYNFLLSTDAPKEYDEQRTRTQSPEFTPRPLPEMAFSVSNSRFDDFQFSLSGTPNHCDYTWIGALDNTNNIRWEVTAPAKNFPKLGKVKASLLSRYPAIGMREFIYSSTSATFRHDGQDYLDYLTQKLSRKQENLNYNYTVRTFKR